MRHLSALAGAFVFLCILFAASAAMGQPANDAPLVDRNALTQLISVVMEILVPILSLLGGFVAWKLTRVFEKKTGYDIPAKQEEQIDKWVEQGIQLASEKAHKMLQEKSEKLRGPQKLEEAVDFVHSFAESRGWIDWSKDKITAKVEAAIGAHRGSPIEGQ